jgi:hypothetical protein
MNVDLKTPGEEAISSLVESIFKTQRFDTSLVDKLHMYPDFRVTFSRYLREHLNKKEFLQPKVLGKLLGVAFEAQKHLDWVLFKELSTDEISAALKLPELSEATSISLCIDTIHGTHKELLQALSLSTSLRELYFFQKPTRTSDKASAELFLELLSTSYQHLLECKILISGPFSRSLNRRFWLPTTNYTPNTKAFPIENMFVRSQLEGTNKYSPEHFYLGDALLKPERFAAGFLQYFRYMAWGKQLYSFACAPSTLADMSRKEISSIPVENSAIPVRPIKRDVERKIFAGLPTERAVNALLPPCWPKVRNLVAGSWVVLVSKELYRDLEGAERQDLNVYPWPSFKSSYFRYAFVRLKMQISLENIGLENLEPDMMEVVGLKQFLQATAPEVDPNLVNQRLKELEAYISSAPKQIPLGAGLDWVSVLKPDEACVILKDFLEDAEYIKENLRLAMEDDPEGTNFLTIFFKYHSRPQKKMTLNMCEFCRTKLVSRAITSCR